MNSPLTPVSGLRADRRAIVAHFVVRRKISHKAIWDFFNSIGQSRHFDPLPATSGPPPITDIAPTPGIEGKEGLEPGTA
jgi:hypothetical protein